MTEALAPLPATLLVRDAYATVSAGLADLLRLGRGPFVAALLLGVVFGGLDPFATSPLAAFAMAIACAWFAFAVFRLVLLGPHRAVLPQAAARDGDPRLVRPSPLGTFMGRAVGLGALGAAGIAAILLGLVVPFTTLPGTAPAAAGFVAVDRLVLAAALAAWPVGVPLARLLPVLPSTAIGEEAGFAAAWRLSRGHALGLATALALIAAPFLFGYAALNAALGMIAGLSGDDGAGLAVNLAALALVAAMGLTMTALGAVAIARAWCAMTGRAPRRHPEDPDGPS